MGWAFPWASSFGSDFNYDYNTSHSEEQERAGPIEYNYHAEVVEPPVEGNSWLDTFAAMAGTDAATYVREGPGVSAFALDDSAVYHTYSGYARGLDGLWACTNSSIAHHSVTTKPECLGFATTKNTDDYVAYLDVRAGR